MRNAYEEGWSDGFDAGVVNAPAVQKAIDADLAEPTPDVLDPETLSEDERVFYDAGYDAGYGDCVIDYDIEEDEVVVDYTDDIDADDIRDRLSNDDLDSYLEDMRTHADG